MSRNRKKPTPSFSIGQLIEWTSQANGNARTKIGIVVDVLKPCYPTEWVNAKYKTRSHGHARDHESYIICVPSPDGAEFFWPRVHGLKPATRYFPMVLAKKEKTELFKPQ